ncbi:MAG TPA: WbuC family cupin fold metalloprotein [Polyangiaceae bacterium]
MASPERASSSTQPELGPIQLLDRALIESTVARAVSSPRLRTNYNFHPDAESNPHRFLNALVRGTYCAPHRHSDPPKSETFLVLEGEVAVFLFGDDGAVVGRHVLGRAGLRGIDISPGHWHSIAALTDTAVCFEVKPGPWVPATDKEFAPWAPRESEPGTAEYLARLIASL